MPIYDADETNKPTLTPGRRILVWDDASSPGDAVAVTNASLQVGLQREGNFPVCLAVSIQFTGAPGAFEVEIQTADVDAEVNYVTKQSITAVNATHGARAELINVVARWVRLKMKARANTVGVQGYIS